MIDLVAFLNTMLAKPQREKTPPSPANLRMEKIIASRRTRPVADLSDDWTSQRARYAVRQLAKTERAEAKRQALALRILQTKRAQARRQQESLA